MPTQFPQSDFTNQFISQSYQDVVQVYNSGASSYFLDGYGNILLEFSSSSIGQTIITSDVTASMTVASASYFQVIYEFSSSFSSQSISSSYAKSSSLAFEVLYDNVYFGSLVHIFIDTNGSKSLS